MILEILSAVFVLTGAFFALVGGLGILRLPDFYSRMHGAALTDTLGAWLILLGLMLIAGFTLITVKLIMLGLLLAVTSPTATHALSNAAWRYGLKPWRAGEDADVSSDR